jgi:hypothetical protein
MEHAIVTLYTLNRYCRETLSVLHSMVTEPVFPEKEFATVVDMNLQRLQVNLANVEYLSQRSLLGSLFGESHPYGKFATGTPRWPNSLAVVASEFGQRGVPVATLPAWFAVWRKPSLREVCEGGRLPQSHNRTPEIVLRQVLHVR